MLLECKIFIILKGLTLKHVGPFVDIRATVMRNLLKTSNFYLISGGMENQFDLHQ